MTIISWCNVFTFNNNQIALCLCRFPTCDLDETEFKIEKRNNALNKTHMKKVQREDEYVLEVENANVHFFLGWKSLHFFGWDCK